jgi:hypothetical protein
MGPADRYIWIRPKEECHVYAFGVRLPITALDGSTIRRIAKLEDTIWEPLAVAQPAAAKRRKSDTLQSLLERLRMAHPARLLI